MELNELVVPALWVLTAVLVGAVLWTGDGVFRYFLTVKPLVTVVVLGVPLLAWALQSHPLLMLIHISGAFLFVGGHAVSALVAFRLTTETDGARAESLLDLSGYGIVWLHIGLAVLILSGIAAGFVEQSWDQVWIWLAIDVLLAISAYMYWGNSGGRGYNAVRKRLEEGGTAAWDEPETRRLVDRAQALRLTLTGTAALLAITALMVFQPG